MVSPFRPHFSHVGNNTTCSALSSVVAKIKSKQCLRVVSQFKSPVCCYSACERRTFYIFSDFSAKWAEHCGEPVTIKRLRGNCRETELGIHLHGA